VTDEPARTTGAPSPLRRQLTVIYTIALALPLVIFASVSYVTFERALLARTDHFIGDALNVFTREAVAERMQAASIRTAIATTVSEVKFRDVRIIVRDSAGGVVATSAPRDPSATDGERILSRPLQVGAERFEVSGAYPLRDLATVLARIRTIFIVAIPLLIVAAATGAYLLAKRTLAPVAEMAERAENALSQQRRFMADASHEMRTPTATLRTEAEVTLARAHRSELEYRESVGVMLQSARRLSRLVDDLFLIARADAGHLVMHTEPVYLEEIVHDAVRAVASVAEKRGVRVELSRMTPAPIVGDRGLLERLVLNLLDNAIKYSSPASSVEVTMGQAPNTHTVSVVDHGPGIAPEDLEKIFERFFRGDAARTRSVDSLTDGAGLGLAIARRIAVAHGGRLVVASSRPGLTEFSLTLPLD
jgi:signal transduction histidine kinase